MAGEVPTIGPDTPSTTPPPQELLNVNPGTLQQFTNARVEGITPAVHGILRLAFPILGAVAALRLMWDAIHTTATGKPKGLIKWFTGSKE